MKFFPKKFWWFGKKQYLCTRFPNEGSRERVLWKIYIDRSSTRSDILFMSMLGIRNEPSICFFTWYNWIVVLSRDNDYFTRLLGANAEPSLLELCWATTKARKKYQRYFLQWRVWSWLRMNASYRLNTCKSRGSRTIACYCCWRPAHGWVTRIQPSP